MAGKKVSLLTRIAVLAVEGFWYFTLIVVFLLTAGLIADSLG